MKIYSSLASRFACCLDWPMDVSGTFQTNWTGTWSGVLKNYSPGAGPEYNVTMEIGPYPKTDHSCTMWRNTYSQHGVIQQIKDYRFCRGNGSDDLYTDEGNSIVIPARWINNVLIAPFKYQNISLTVFDRMVGDVLEEKILLVQDKPATDGVVTMLPLQVQLMKLKRVSH